MRLLDTPQIKICLKYSLLEESFREARCIGWRVDLSDTVLDTKCISALPDVSGCPRHVKTPLRMSIRTKNHIGRYINSQPREESEEGLKFVENAESTFGENPKEIHSLTDSNLMPAVEEILRMRD